MVIRRGNEAFILGAGFSCAISPEYMPSTKELGRALLGNAERNTVTPLDSDDNWVRHYKAYGCDFEKLMSYLGTPQPWLTETQNLLNRAQFLRLASDIQNELLNRQRNLVMGTPQPAWLPRLVRAWHERLTTVATFNYDTLIEKTFLEEVKGFTLANLYRAPIADMRSRTHVILTEEEETFWFLKLHGSMNWYYSGAVDYFGEQIYFVRPGAGWSFTPEDYPDRLTGNPDKQTLIIPPTTSKSAFFANESVASQWQVLNFLLKHGQRFYLVGYSLPPSDQMVRFMFAPTNSDGNERTVWVVNLARRDELEEHYKSAFPYVENWDFTYTGRASAVEEFALAYADGSLRFRGDG
jgi:hypothetical protein